MGSSSTGPRWRPPRRKFRRSPSSARPHESGDPELDSRLRGNERKNRRSALRRGASVQSFAHVLDEKARLRFREAGNAQRVEAARALDADGVPEEAADMGHFGDVRERQMLVDAAPRDQPIFDDVGRNADLVGDHAGGKYPPREIKMKKRPEPA